jgi:hypothetical protein
MGVYRWLAICTLSILSSLASAAYAAGDALNAISIGTKITKRNWQQYRQFMPGGMIVLFEGTISGTRTC